MRQSTTMRLFSYIRFSLPGYLIGALGLATVLTVGELAKAMLLKNMFDAIALKDVALLVNGLLYTAVVFVSIFVLAPLTEYLYTASTIRITGQIKMKVFEHLAHLPLEYFQQNHSGDLISKLTNDISTMEQGYSNDLSSLVNNFFIGIGSGIYLVILDWRLFLFSILSGVLVLLVYIRLMGSLRHIGEEIQMNLGALTERLVDILSGMPVIKAFNLQRIMSDAYREVNQKTYQARLKQIHKVAILIAWGLVFGLSILKVCLGSYLAIKGLITVGVIMAFLQLHNNIDLLFRSTGSFLTNLQSSLAAADRVFQILDQKPEELQNIFQIDPTQSGQMIAMKNVSFAYSSEESVLKDLTFSVKQGEVVALVGPSGGGKSTLLKLLLGFYQPSAGQIQIGHTLLKDPTDLRQQVAYVPQDAYLFAGSIRENIAYGTGKEPGTDEVVRAAKVANAFEFITSLEAGFETQVGERGFFLSGGQRQRIAIARAILKDAPILLLDEATSALDTESEELVQQGIQKLMEERTTVVIAHRLSTIQYADRILVIEDGQIVAEGTHEQLLNNTNGRYRHLFLQQFSIDEQAV